MQISRFTSSKPSKSAFASDEKSIRRPTTSFVRYRLNKPVNGGKRPAACRPLQVFALEMGLFAAKSRPASSYTLDTFENSRGFDLFERFKGFFGSLSWRSRVSCCYGFAFSPILRDEPDYWIHCGNQEGERRSISCLCREKADERFAALLCRSSGRSAKSRFLREKAARHDESRRAAWGGYLMYLSMISCMAPSEIISSSALSIFSSSSVFSLDMHSA